MTVENEAVFTLSGEIGGLTIDITLRHADSARLRSGVIRFTRQITNEMVSYALEEKRLTAGERVKTAAEARRLHRRTAEPIILKDIDEEEDDDEDEDV